MTASTLRQLLADVLAEKMVETEPNQHAAWPRCIRIAGHQADALLASPLAEILDYASSWAWIDGAPSLSPEGRERILNWREARAKRVEPEAPYRMMGSSVNEAPFERPTP